MPSLSLARNGKPTPLILAAGVLLSGWCPTSPTLAGAEPNRSSFTAAKPEAVGGREHRLLERFRRSLDEQRWDDAWNLVGRLVETDSPGMVPVDESLYVSLPDYCQRLLSRLPLEVLEGYRALVDPIAEAWYREAVAQRDCQGLQRVVDEYFCSSWGDDALLALGELALGRGEYQAARSYWQALLSNSAVMNFPNSTARAVDVQARLALVSIRAEQWERAEAEIAQLASAHPKAQGRLAGHDVVYAEQLPQLLKQARHWPPVTDSTAPSTAALSDLGAQWAPVWSHSFASEQQNFPNVYPIVVNDLVVYQDSTGVYALQLATGEVAFHTDGSLVGSEGSTLATRGNQVYGVSSNGSLWGMDLNRDGALCFRSEKGITKSLCTGAIVIDGWRLLAETHATSHAIGTSLKCHDLATGQFLWQRRLSRVSQSFVQSGGGTLAKSPGIVYICTNLGSIAAVRVDEGQVLWLRTYEREVSIAEEKRIVPTRNRCMYHSGVLYALPSDSRQLLALDAATGRLLWTRSALQPSAAIVGITSDRLVLANGGLHLLEPETGNIVTSNFDLRLAGQGLVANDVIVWPTNQSIGRLHLSNGDAIGGEVPLPESGGANLLLVGDYVLAAGPTQLTVFRFAASRTDESS